MTDAYRPCKTHKFSFGLWTIMNVGQDPFGDATREPLSGLAAIVELGKRNVYSYELHAEDLVPEGSTAAQRRKIVKAAKTRMADHDIRATSIGCNIFYEPVFKDGGLTSHDPSIRQHTVQRYVKAIDLGAELGATLCNIWGGREGAETDAAKDPAEGIKRFREAFNYLSEYVRSQKLKGFRLSVEPKPNEPRGDILLPTSGHVLGFIATLDHPEMVGVVPELAHVRMAGLNCYHEISQVLECGKLFGIHLNAQKPLRFDQDLRFGAEDLKESFFVVKALEDGGYPGTRTFDAHAYRTVDHQGVWDFVEGCMRTYLILKDKVAQFSSDPVVQGILGELRGDGGSPRGTAPSPVAALPDPTTLKRKKFDLKKLAQTRLPYEELDQRLQEILLEVAR